MTPETYVSIAFLVGFVALTLGIIAAYKDNVNYGTGMLAMGVVVAFAGALMAGALWPASVLIGGIVGGLKWLKWSQERRRHKADQARYDPVRPVTDYERYRTMAAEQRALATRARSDGMGDLARMQEGLASQYEQTANIYRT